jgi:hypothetical protein
MEPMTLGASIISGALQLIGIIIPPLVEVINKDVKSQNERFLVTVVVCFLAAVFLKWNDIVYGSFADVLTSFGIVFTESQVVYKLYFRDSAIRYKIQEKIGVEEDPPTGEGQ